MNHDSRTLPRVPDSKSHHRRHRMIKRGEVNLVVSVFSFPGNFLKSNENTDVDLYYTEL
jgi:hypothetical protein